MPDQYKGYPQYYDDSLNALFGSSFYEWKLDNVNNLETGQLCRTVVNYNIDKTYQLILHNHEPKSEYESTWKLAPLSCRVPIRNERLQAFNLETNERFIIRRAKLRFSILLSRIEDDFIVPGNDARLLKEWIVLPLFSYKEKHSQEYILHDQRLLSKDRFYIPPTIETSLRLQNESAARYNLIQPAVETDIQPITALNNNLGMQKGIKISKGALKLIVYHYYKSLKILKELDTENDGIESQYDLFKSIIGELIDSNIKK